MDQKILNEAKKLGIETTYEDREEITSNTTMYYSGCDMTYKDFCEKVDEILKRHNSAGCVFHVDDRIDVYEERNEFVIYACMLKEKTEEELIEEIEHKKASLRADIERKLKLLED